MSSPHPTAGEQSNSSIIIPGFGVLKFYRHLTSGIQPEVEIGLYLTEQPRKVNVPPVLGYAEIEFAGGKKSALAILHAFVDNQGDGWAYTLAYLNRIVDHFIVLDEKETKKGAKESRDLHKDYLDFARTLGQRTAEVHLALGGASTNEAFAPEPIVQQDVDHWVAEARAQAHEVRWNGCARGRAKAN